MKINGEIGQEILLSGKIKKIMINEDGMVEYCVNVSRSDFSFWLDAPDIVFKTLGEVVDEDDFRKEYPVRFPDRIVEELKAENATDCDSSETEEEWFTVEQPKKKRGRPRKATVEDLKKRAEEMHKADENRLNSDWGDMEV